MVFRSAIVNSFARHSLPPEWVRECHAQPGVAPAPPCHHSHHRPSPYRSPEQTDIARFWSTNAVVQYNTAFTQLTHTRELDAVQAARLFAMGNLVGADALIGCFDAKYHYLFWRPQYAVPAGDADGNPATVGIRRGRRCWRRRTIPNTRRRTAA